MRSITRTAKSPTHGMLITVWAIAFAQLLPAQLPSPLARFGNLPCLAPIIQGIDHADPKNIGEALLLPPYDTPEFSLKVGSASFPISTSVPEAQKAFNHGIALLHLFWTGEAERAFRQAASLDPEHPMPYWAMAMANERFPGRASVYINYANHLAGKNPETTPLEHAWIETYRHYYNPGPGNPESRTPKSRSQRNRRLEDMAYTYPDDFEIRAFLLREIILDDFRAGIPITGKFATDALARQLAGQAPDHPSRHYRLWLWSRQRPMRVAEEALTAPLISPQAPNAWRFSADALARAGLFHDSLRAGENAIRLDHQRMQARFTMPDDAQNYISNVVSLVDTMIACGRINAAESVAKALINLPRPAYKESSKLTTAAKKNGSYITGRELMARLYIRSDQWDKLLKQCTAPKGMLLPGKDWIGRAHNLYWQSIANLNLANTQQAAEASRKMESLFREFLSAGSGAGTEKEITHALKSLRAYTRFFNNPATGTPKEKLLHIGNYHLARVARKKNNMKIALELARQDLLGRPGQPDAKANFCSIALSAGTTNSRNEALMAFDSQLRRNASLADRDHILFHTELQPIISQLKLRGNWTLPRSNPKKTVTFPDPEELGPIAWRPPPAPSWSLPTAGGKKLSLRQLKGKPVLLIFFVGIGCPYCVEQLKAFAPHGENYSGQGIDIIAISSDDEEMLRKRVAAGQNKAEAIPEFPFPLLSDPSLQTFKDYRCFDPHGNKAMHGVFLISPQGTILWNNISHEPFLNPDFLLHESSRLLKSQGSNP
ncbi:MAG: peroxiredoxin family protein [Verrucomicrobiota bacterium]|nr:peroxiredoxin family protein [Verrucomicrobiota bacterium]